VRPVGRWATPAEARPRSTAPRRCRITLRGGQGRLRLPPKAAWAQIRQERGRAVESIARSAHSGAALHSPEGAMHSQVSAASEPATKGGPQGNPPPLEDYHQGKQLFLFKLLLVVDLRVCAPGRTRTCNLRIRSKARPVCPVLPWTIAAGYAGSAVRLGPSRPAPSQRPDCHRDCRYRRGFPRSAARWIQGARAADGARHPGSRRGGRAGPRTR
jgi:hypothetical protein